MSFIIARRREGARYPEYFAGSGLPKAFTPYKCRAKRFTTRAEAEAERCPDNEWVCTL